MSDGMISGMRPITKGRALEQVETVLHAALRRDYGFLKGMSEDRIKEILVRVGEAREDVAKLDNIEKELETMKRNVGQLGSQDPD